MALDPIYGNLSAREALALERTHLATERTLLAYMRTSLAMAVAGISGVRLVHDWILITCGYVLIFSSLIVFVVGYFRRRHSVSRTKHIMPIDQMLPAEDANSDRVDFGHAPSGAAPSGKFASRT